METNSTLENCESQGCGCDQQGSSNELRKVSANLSRQDRIGMVRCRISNKYRSHYSVAPGLYALGSPGNLSPVFVSANYRYSFDILRASLKGVDCYILVLDTRGINVWCAAGKGTFGTDELVRRIEMTRLTEVVELKRLIVPQLGAVGIAAHRVKERTGFTVLFGPVDARDLPEYLGRKMKATPEMRSVRFNLWDRFVLTPMELVPALRKLLPIVAVLFVLAGIDRTGVLFVPAFDFFGIAGTAAAAGCIAGAFLGPLLLPAIPFRSFAVKGALLGLVFPLVMVLAFRGEFGSNPFLYLAACVSVPALSSYLLLQFTGSSTITGISGVTKELRFGLPIYRIAAVATIVLTAAAFLRHWSII